MTNASFALLDFEDARPEVLPVEEVVAIAAAEELAERVRGLAIAQLRPALYGPTVAQHAVECRELLRDLAAWVEEVTL